MNIIEAIKSGKPFKRKTTMAWSSPNPDAYFSTYDILADDWEIKQEPREWEVIVADNNRIVSADMFKHSTCNRIKVREVIE